MAVADSKILTTKVEESCRSEFPTGDPFLNSTGPVFYSEDFERHLVMTYLGPESPVSPPLSSPSRGLEDQLDPFDIYNLGDDGTYIEDSGFSPKMEPLSPPRVPTALATRRHHPYQKTSTISMPPPAPKRGRPKKATSHSKQANYARSYREMKKAELEKNELMVDRLRRENDNLRQENASIKTEMKQLHYEMGRLRKLIEQDQLGAIFQKLGGGGPSIPKTDLNGGGVCLHLGANKVSLEVCERCEAKNKASGSGYADTPLFGGDFESIAPFIR